MASLFAEESIERWQTCLRGYATVIKALSDKKIESAMKAKKPKPKPSLLQLDNWYQKDLPSAVAARSPPHLNHDEITKLMQWKLTRGKFRPRLAQMVQENSPATVQKCTGDAFTAYEKDRDLGGAIDKLSTLKAVGPATASALMACRFPDTCAFMADESVTSVSPGATIQYTRSGYLAYASKVTAKARKLRAKDKSHKWSAHDVELALWTEALAAKLDVKLAGNGDDGDDTTSAASEPAAKRSRKE